jgi:hypothetical protein
LTESSQRFSLGAHRLETTRTLELSSLYGSEAPTTVPTMHTPDALVAADACNCLGGGGNPLRHPAFRAREWDPSIQRRVLCQTRHMRLWGVAHVGIFWQGFRMHMVEYAVGEIRVLSVRF